MAGKLRTGYANTDIIVNENSTLIHESFMDDAYYNKLFDTSISNGSWANFGQRTRGLAVGNGIVVSTSLSSFQIYPIRNRIENGSLFNSFFSPPIDPTPISKIGVNSWGSHGQVSVGCGRIVIGSSLDNGGDGRVVVYDLDGNEQFTLNPNPTGLSDAFGGGVDVGCNRIVVTERNGSPDNLYIFDLEGNQLFKSSDSRSKELVSIGNGIIAVGDAFTSDGQVHIYSITGDFIQTLTPPTAGTVERFGYDVEIGSGHIVISSNQGVVRLYDLNFNLKWELNNLAKYGNARVDIGGGFVGVGMPSDLFRDRGSYEIYTLEGDLVDRTENGFGQDNDELGSSIAIGEGICVAGGGFIDFSTSGANRGKLFFRFLEKNVNTYYETSIS